MRKRLFWITWVFFNFSVRILFYFQILYGLARIRNRYKCTINPLARLGSGCSLLARESESIRLQDGRVCTNIFRCTPSIISANPYIFVGIRSYILISTEKELVWVFYKSNRLLQPRSLFTDKFEFNTGERVFQCLPITISATFVNLKTVFNIIFNFLKFTDLSLGQPA